MTGESTKSADTIDAETKVEAKEIYKVGDITEGTVIAVDRSTIYVDLPPSNVGIIYGSEFLIVRDVVKKVKVGDVFSAKVIGISEKADGYLDLSLKEALAATVWKKAEDAISSGEIYDVVAKEANKGGLIINWNGVRGFLPASQLSKKHYPKVLNSDKFAILNELKKIIGLTVSVRVISADAENEKLIFAESEGDASQQSGKILNDDMEYEVGDTASGVVTGTVEFGLFVQINKKTCGLVHISEISWGLVDDPRKFYSVGDHVKVKIINKDDEKYSFSIKVLEKNPWSKAKEKYKVGDEVKGVIIKHNHHGAFASIESGVSGLVHSSNFKNEEEMYMEMGIGQTHTFTIFNFVPDEQKLILTPKTK